MRWLITGAIGMLGSDIHSQLRELDADIIAVDLAEVDITDRDAVLYLAKQVRPSVIVNCAAFTRVDDCETNEETATRVNGTAVEHLAEAANRWDAVLTHISTDFVFDGSKTSPYEINDTPAPLSAYGRSKLAGEEAAKKAWKHVIVRTSWLFGTRGWNFVEAIRKQVLSGKRELRVVNDQRGRPTYTPHLAAALIRLSQRAGSDENARGMFHYADEPECTWFDFAQEIVRRTRDDAHITEDVVVLPVSSSEFPRPATRPAYSVLSTERYERVTGVRPGSWQEALDEYFELLPSSRVMQA